MNLQAWSIVVGVATSAMLALGPWMFMVHAKLAVIVMQIAELDEKMEKATEANRELWLITSQHEARLETHGVQFAHVAERLQDA